VIPVLSIPTASNSDGKTTMDTNVSDPTRKPELEGLTAEHFEKVKQANKEILPLKENDYLCKNFILNFLTVHLYDLYLIHGIICTICLANQMYDLYLIHGSAVQLLQLRSTRSYGTKVQQQIQ